MKTTEPEKEKTATAETKKPAKPKRVKKYEHTQKFQLVSTLNPDDQGSKQYVQMAQCKKCRVCVGIGDEKQHRCVKEKN